MNLNIICLCDNRWTDMYFESVVISEKKICCGIMNMSLSKAFQLTGERAERRLDCLLMKI